MQVLDMLVLDMVMDRVRGMDMAATMADTEVVIMVLLTRPLLIMLKFKTS